MSRETFTEAITSTEASDLSALAPTTAQTQIVFREAAGYILKIEWSI